MAVSLKHRRRSDSELTVVSLFSGGGGFDLGIEAVGFRTLFASDIDSHSCTTLRWGQAAARKRRRPFLQHASIVQADIAHLEGKAILAELDEKGQRISLLIGGPPCQAFSVFGRRRGRDDPRGRLVLEYLRLLAELRPTCFVFENVYGMLTVENGAVLREVQERLTNPSKELYYRISIHRVDAVDYAVPQFRDRIFIIGHAEGKTISEIPKVTSNKPSLFEILPAWRTVRDAFRGLPSVGSEGIQNHVGRVHSERIIERYSNLRPGERDPVTRINKLDLNRPSFTIIVGSDKGGGKGHVHPIEPREVTPRESARIQTFPDWWAFSGTSRHPIRQVGNAVPPLLAAAIGNEIKAQLFCMQRAPFGSILRLLDQEHLFDDHGFDDHGPVQP
jgi:DNA (cytosine-5)-methyltransferase 1